ncbi:Set2p [Rhizophagus irregularis DAOM 197198w]|uniref:[histone H3]-lysine(36) N-trimethyltransferase n=1 Tax=Rhizophagus irregularis (strain DAOM 197198w) TaxID=1432141 RepID=A0A015K3D5_RHIIW|nr:Set2p [Rhizophagus irregularis DAOM 197198w]
MVKLYNDYPSCDDKAKRLFEEIKENIYKGNVGLVGKQDTDYRCCCKYEQGKDAASQACGEFAGCVNRELFMECRDGDCATGKFCQNRRFQRAENAKVDVIHFALKGYGLRAMEPLRPNQFIMEYVGEVIKNSAFFKRMITYNKQGLKHFYFMSLQAGGGCTSRFMNHSCNPNCYIQKWMIGDRYRIGIFALRNVRENEELTFDYNADRYGSQAQKCHCGESNCRGVIGGTKETNLNIKDEAEIEAELTEPIRSIDEVKQFINLMYKSLEQPSMVRPILYRLKLTEDVAILRMFMKLFGGIMLKSYLYEFRNDDEIVFKTLNIADKIPFKYRDRRVETSHLKEWVSKFESRNDRIGAKARDLIDKWDKLPSCGPELNELQKQDVNHTLDLADDDEVQIETPSVKTNRDRESFNQNKDDLKGKPIERNNLGHTNYTNNISGLANNSSDKGRTPQDLNPNRYESSHDFYNRYMDSNAIFQSISQFEYWCKTLGCKVPSPDYYDGIVKMRPDNPYGCTYAPRPTFNMNYVSNSRSRLSGINNRRFVKPRNHSMATKTTSTEEQKDQSQQPPQEQLEPLAPNWYETKDEYGKVYYYNKYTLQASWERPVVKDDVKSYDGFSQAALQAIIERAEAMAREAEKQRERAAREKAEAEEKAALEAAHGVPLNTPMNEKEFKMAIYKLVINYCSRFKSHFNEVDFKGFSREIGKSIQKKELRRDKWVGAAAYMVTENMRAHIKESVIDYMQKAVTLTEKRAEEKKRKRDDDDVQVPQKSPKA